MRNNERVSAVGIEDEEKMDNKRKVEYNILVADKEPKLHQ